MLVSWIMVAAPDSQYILNGKYEYRHHIKIMKERSVFIVNWLYRFENNSGHIQYNENNDKGIQYFVPAGITQFGMKQDMNFMFGGMIHVAACFGWLKLWYNILSFIGL